MKKITLALLALAALAFAGEAQAQTPPAAYYGSGLEAGAVVTAHIGDNRCGRAVANAAGLWNIVIQAGGCGGAAVDGATVTFMIGDAAAYPSAPWRGGYVPADLSEGIALTLGSTTPPAVYYGGGLEAGDVVTADIDGRRCGLAVADAAGEWAITIAAGGCGGAAVAGAEVTIWWANGDRSAAATWSAGGTPENIAEGIALAEAPAPPATPPAECAVQTYRVRAGDAVWTIARELAPPNADYADFARRIAILNGLGPGSTLRIGQVLLIPPRP